MALLESAMAFAVVMMIFSTIVTGIVEAILKLAGTRENNLKKTVEALFLKVVWPRLGDSLQTVRPQQASGRNVSNKSRLHWFKKERSPHDFHREKFVKDLTGNPVFEQEARKSFVSLHNKSTIDSLSLLSFAERLGKTDVGHAIIAEGEAQMELLVQDLVRGFDRFGRAASEVFRKKAQLTAICVAIPFALIANIDASRIFTQLIENPQIRSGLIEKAEEANVENTNAVARLKTVQDELENLPKAATGVGVVVDSKSTEETDLQEELGRVADMVRESVSKMEAQGLAIGWSWYPFCAEGHNDVYCEGRVGWTDSNSHKVDIFDIAMTANFLMWFFMATFAGVLIGLGGPFWFKVFSGLAQVFQVMRALGIGGQKPAASTEPSTGKDAEDSAKPKDVLDAFKVAVAVNMGALAKPPSRTILGPNGEPL